MYVAVKKATFVLQASTISTNTRVPTATPVAKGDVEGSTADSSTGLEGVQLGLIIAGGVILLLCCGAIAVKQRASKAGDPEGAQQANSSTHATGLTPNYSTAGYVVCSCCVPRCFVARRGQCRSAHLCGIFDARLVHVLAHCPS